MFQRTEIHPPEQDSDSKKLFSKEIGRQRPVKKEMSYPRKMDSDTVTASIYNTSETDKSGFYKAFWGDHFRNLYSKKNCLTCLVHR